MKHRISKEERALLTFAGAQRIAGRGKTPSARQVRKAHDQAGCSVAKHGVVVHGGADAADPLVNGVCGVLSGIGGETDVECGSFWSKLKSFASSAANKAAPLAPLAPLFGPAIAVAVPVTQHLLRNRGGGGAPAPAQAEESLQEISGMGFGPERQKIEDYTYIFGTEDEMILGEGGGTTELAALQRRRGGGWTGPCFPGAMRQPRSSSMGAVPHDAYRVAILKEARKTGGNNPTAKQMAQAQATVDKVIKAQGLFVAIPGGRPGRVTR